MSTAEKFGPADRWAYLQAALPCSIIGRNIIVLGQTSSTNDAILQVAGAAVSSLPTGASAKEGPPSLVDEGLVLFADIKPPGAVSGVTVGKRRRAKVFGFQSCYSPRSSSVTRDG